MAFYIKYNKKETRITGPLLRGYSESLFFSEQESGCSIEQKSDGRNDHAPADPDIQDFIRIASDKSAYGERSGGKHTAVFSRDPGGGSSSDAESGIRAQGSSQSQDDGKDDSVGRPGGTQQNSRQEAEKKNTCREQGSCLSDENSRVLEPVVQREL